MKKYLIISITSSMVLLIGLSYSYFQVNIVNKDLDELTVDSKELKIIFYDSREIIAEGIKPGTFNETKSFTVENKAEDTYNYNIVFKDLINTFVTNGFLQYKIEHTSADGYATTSDNDNWIDVPNTKEQADITIAYNIPIEVNEKHEYIISFRYQDSQTINQNDDQGKSFNTLLAITEGTEAPWYYDTNSLYYQILSDNGALNESKVKERTDFNTAYTSSTDTFFKTNNAELGQTVYYYAGDARNNWVIFGQNSAGDDLYWRIIRTNEKDTGGGIRLLYSGSGLQTDKNGNHQIKAVQNAYIGSSNWNNDTYDKPNYGGYTRKTNDYIEGQTKLSDIRGNNIDSNIKKVVDNWYVNILLGTDYETVLDTKAVYCNDRSTTSNKTAGLTIGTNFGAFGRLQSYKSPSYACGGECKGIW